MNQKHISTTQAAAKPLLFPFGDAAVTAAAYDKAANRVTVAAQALIDIDISLDKAIIAEAAALKRSTVSKHLAAADAVAVLSEASYDAEDTLRAAMKVRAALAAAVLLGD